VIPIVLIVLAVLSLFALAIALPNRISNVIARAVAGVAVAVQVVALVLFVVLSAGDYSPPVLLWIAVGWIVFPLGATVLGLAISFANPARVVALWVVSLALFALSLPIIVSAGAFVAPSALLMLVTSIFALGSQFDHGSTQVEPASG
jgi:hypothetical protein